MLDLKKLYDLSFAVNMCEQIKGDEEVADALNLLNDAQTNFEKVVLSQRLCESEKAQNHLESQKPSQVSTHHGKELEE